MKAKRVKLNDLVKIFPGPGGEEVVAVDQLSLEIEPGDMVTLLGPSGCGKTTTLRMVAGFELPDSGEIYIDDVEISTQAANKRDTAMVFQSYALFPHMTVWDNISYGLKLRKLSAREIKDKAERIMSLVGLKGYEKRSSGQLSGGQQQRVALARALVVEPNVLLFDEPLSNLDAKLREQMRDEIRRVQQRLKITSIYVTHDQAEAMSISDKIVVMNNGKIEQVGTPQEIYRYPSTRFVADFIGKVNFFPVQNCVRKGKNIEVQVLDQSISIETAVEYQMNDSLRIMHRPEAIELSHKDGIPGKIEKVTYLGSTVEYVVELFNSQMVTVIQSNPLPHQIFQTGDQIGVCLEGINAHLLTAD